MSKTVIIVGNSNTKLMALKLAELKERHPDAHVVTPDEAKELDLSETYEFKIQQDYSHVQSECLPLTRAQRRKNQRKTKNKKR